MNKLKENGFPLTTFRGAGGGIRLEWWTRLKCDLTNIPIEIVNQQETGTVGAASLAGLATGRFKDLEDALMELVRVKQRIEPDVGRFAMYEEKISSYKSTLELLLSDKNGQY